MTGARGPDGSIRELKRADGARHEWEPRADHDA